jgi:hypothetical protein
VHTHYNYISNTAMKIYAGTLDSEVPACVPTAYIQQASERRVPSQTNNTVRHAGSSMKNKAKLSI